MVEAHFAIVHDVVLIETRAYFSEINCTNFINFVKKFTSFTKQFHEFICEIRLNKNSTNFL